MKSTFYLSTQKQNQDLYIELHGIFDGASALELSHTITEEYDPGNAVVIDTDQLSMACSLGKILSIGG